MLLLSTALLLSLLSQHVFASYLAAPYQVCRSPWACPNLSPSIWRACSTHDLLALSKTDRLTLIGRILLVVRLPETTLNHTVNHPSGPRRRTLTSRPGSAYRMEIEAFGDPSLAPLCRGTAPGRTCNFDEFLNYLQRDKKKLAPGQRTSVGRKYWPDAIKTAQELTRLRETSGVIMIRE